MHEISDTIDYSLTDKYEISNPMTPHNTDTNKKIMAYLNPCLAIVFISMVLASCQDKNTFKIAETTENSVQINSMDNSLLLRFNHGDISALQELKYDSKSGNAWEYYPNGNIKSKYYYQEGIAIDEAYEYHINGSLSAYKFFDTKGRLAYIRNYAEDGSFDSESGVLITYNEDAISLNNDTLILFIQMPEPPGTKMSSVIVFEDPSLNPIDSLSFATPNYEVKVAVNKATSLFVKAQLNEKEVFTCNDKRISIEDLLKHIPNNQFWVSFHSFRVNY